MNGKYIQLGKKIRLTLGFIFFGFALFGYVALKLNASQFQIVKQQNPNIAEATVLSNDLIQGDKGEARELRVEFNDKNGDLSRTTIRLAGFRTMNAETAGLKAGDTVRIAYIQRNARTEAYPATYNGYQEYLKSVFTFDGSQAILLYPALILISLFLGLSFFTQGITFVYKKYGRPLQLLVPILSTIVISLILLLLL